MKAEAGVDDFRDISVLYVEDDPHHRTCFNTVMAGRFGELRTAESAEQALEIYRERPCDLLVTDLLMSGMGGLELCRLVRRSSHEIPIVITSAMLSRTMLLECVNVGVDGYILKPIEPAMVRTVVTQAVARLRLRRQHGQDARLWQQTFDAVPDMVVLLDQDLTVMRLNRAALRLLNMGESEVLGREYCRLLYGEGHEECRACIRQALDEGREYIGKTLLEVRNRYYHVTVSPLRDAHGTTIGAVHMARDMTRQKRTEDSLRYAGTHDQLTTLYNRTWFETECEQLVRGSIAPISVLVADLDGLKRVNDESGHKAGDDLLVRAATLLIACCRAGDGIARVGGDEFAVLLPGLTERDAEKIVDRIRQRMREERLTLGDGAISLSLGVATAEQSGDLPGALLLADRRMYEDKASRRPIGA